MQRLLELETELANFERQTLRPITAEQKRQILQLARWAAPLSRCGLCTRGSWSN
jgi:hypothetical protein